MPQVIGIKEKSAKQDSQPATNTNPAHQKTPKAYVPYQHQKIGGYSKMGLARKIGAKLYNFGVHRYNEYQDEQRFRREEKETFKQAERKGRLKHAAKEGYKKGRTPRQRQSIIRTDLDPFGIFQGSRPTKKKAHRSGTTIIIQGSNVRTRRKKKSRNYLDQLL